MSNSGCVRVLVDRRGLFSFVAGVLEQCPREFVVVRCRSCEPTNTDVVDPLVPNASNRCRRQRVASSFLFAGNLTE